MGEIVALALGIAASPFAILPAVLLLFSPQPRASALAYLSTWFVSIAVVTTIFASLAGVIGLSDAPPDWVAWVRIAAGLGLIGFAVQQWVTRPATPKSPRWMEKLQTATPRSASGLALLLSIANPKIVLLAVVGGVDIGGAEWALSTQLLGIGIFAAVSSITVALPVGVHVVAGRRALEPLSLVKDWLIRNNVAVLAAVFLGLGIGLVYNGVVGLQRPRNQGDRHTQDIRLDFHRMCQQVTCKICQKKTWAGCGQHVQQVMSGVPKAQQCSCTAADKAAYKAAHPGFFARLFGKSKAKQSPEGGSLWADDASVKVVWVNNFLHPVDQIQLARGQGSPALDGEPIQWAPAQAYEFANVGVTRNGDPLVLSYGAVVSDLVVEGEEYRAAASPRMLTYLLSPDS